MKIVADFGNYTSHRFPAETATICQQCGQGFRGYIIMVDSIRDSIQIRIVMPDSIRYSIRMQTADSQVPR